MVYDGRRLRHHFPGLRPPYLMSLIGNLEDLGLGEILQIVSLARKTGILRLSSRGREGTIVFRIGRVIQATSSAFHENLGEVLVRKGCLDLATLRNALALQEQNGFRERFGAILVRHFGVSAVVIDEVVREQIEKVVYSLFSWVEGSFDFELRESVEATDVTSLDPLQFMLDQGLNPQILAMEGVRIADEERRRWGAGERSALPAAASGRVSKPGVKTDGVFDLIREPSATEPAAKVKKIPLVLVDDDEAVLDLLAELLERGGYQVFPFSRSEEALTRIDTLFRQGECPLLVVDLIMPRMDGTGLLGGLELLELTRVNFPDLGLLVVSDYYNSDAERRVGELGCSHIIKPRRSEIHDDAAMEEFGSRLLAEIEKLRTGAQPAGAAETVNLGDELRLELGDQPAEPAIGVEPLSGISLLRGMLDELNDPALGGGITLLVLRFAAEFMNRAVIFMVQGDELIGLGQFGITDPGGPADARVRRLRVPLGEESLFAGVIEARHPAVVRPEQGRWNRYLFGQLGDGTPDEVFLGPIVSEGRVVAILYGDNVPERKPIRGTEPLEIFLSQAGVAMERALLERKLELICK